MPTADLDPDAAEFYSAQSAFSDPGEFAALYDGLPADPAALAEVARGLIVHRFEGAPFKYDIPQDRMSNDAESRYIDDILRIVVERDSAPLVQPRAAEDRFVGICRDFTLLHCSLLRHAGIPARARSGFADYFGGDGFHVDHMVTEYWDAGRGWLLADAQLADPVVVEPMEVDFDPMDVPRDRFLVAGAAWRAIREQGADPKRFGLPVPGLDLIGAWFVAGNVRLDLAALNKSETLLWDIWGIGAPSDEELTEEIRRFYDGVAQVISGEVPFAEARKLYTEDENLRTPKTVLSLAQFNGPQQVTLR
jgi:hypothetical protein